MHHFNVKWQMYVRPCCLKYDRWANSTGIMWELVKLQNPESLFNFIQSKICILTRSSGDLQAYLKSEKHWYKMWPLSGREEGNKWLLWSKCWERKLYAPSKAKDNCLNLANLRSSNKDTWILTAPHSWSMRAKPPTAVHNCLPPLSRRLSPFRCGSLPVIFQTCTPSYKGLLPLPQHVLWGEDRFLPAPKLVTDALCCSWGTKALTWLCRLWEPCICWSLFEPWSLSPDHFYSRL